MRSRRRPWMLLLACASALPLAWLATAQEVVRDIPWRTDYNQALHESEKRGLPLVKGLVIIGAPGDEIGRAHV